MVRMPNRIGEKILLDTHQAAQFFNVEEQTILSWVREENLPYVQKGECRRNYRYDSQALLDWANDKSKNEDTRNYLEVAQRNRHYAFDPEKAKIRKKDFDALCQDGFITSKNLKALMGSQYILYPMIAKHDFPLTFAIKRIVCHRVKDVTEWLQARDLLVDDLGAPVKASSVEEEPEKSEAVETPKADNSESAPEIERDSDIQDDEESSANDYLMDRVDKALDGISAFIDIFRFALENYRRKVLAGKFRKEPAKNKTFCIEETDREIEEATKKELQPTGKKTKPKQLELKNAR